MYSKPFVFWKELCFVVVVVVVDCAYFLLDLIQGYVPASQKPALWLLGGTVVL